MGVVNIMPRAIYLPGKIPLLTEQKGGWAQGSVSRYRRRQKSFPHPGFENRTLQPVSQSVYRLPKTNIILKLTKGDMTP
jgi:hypothetical protein